jgi:AraC-like DNA-binding protein
MRTYGVENPHLRSKLARIFKKSTISLEQWRELLAEGAASAPIPHVGMQIGSEVTVKHTGALGYLLLNCNNLVDALETYQLFERRFYSINFSRIEHIDSSFSLSWPDKLGILNALFVQVMITALVTFLRKRFPTTCKLIQVTLTGPPPDEMKPYTKYFRCPVVFESIRPGITFDHEIASQVERGELSKSFYSIQSLQTEAYYRVNLATTPFLRQLYKVLLKLVPEGKVSLVSVAKKIGGSPRTLQRRLLELGFSYQTLLDAVREQLGCRYLANTDLTLFEVAMLLGFSEQSAFNRAFKHWTGETPGSYRLQNRNL